MSCLISSLVSVRKYGTVFYLWCDDREGVAYVDPLHDLTLSYYYLFFYNLVFINFLLKVVNLSVFPGGLKGFLLYELLIKLCLFTGVSLV